MPEGDEGLTREDMVQLLKVLYVEFHRRGLPAEEILQGMSPETLWAMAEKLKDDEPSPPGQ
jgi:hypothetical protein